MNINADFDEYVCSWHSTEGLHSHRAPDILFGAHARKKILYQYLVNGTRHRVKTNTWNILRQW